MTRDLRKQVADLAARVRQTAALGPDPAALAEHVTAGGGAAAVLPSGTAELLREQARRVQTADLAAYEDSPWRPLHVREFAATVSELRQQLDRAVPDPGPFGMINAATALELAAAALRAAADTGRPHVAPGRSAYPVDPAEAAALFDRLGDVAERLVDASDMLRAQLVRLHVDALNGRVAGPPGSSAHAEVERIIRHVADLGAAAGEARDAATPAVARAVRLRVADLPDNP